MGWAAKLWSGSRRTFTDVWNNTSGGSTTGSANAVGAPQEASNCDEQGAPRLEPTEPSGQHKKAEVEKWWPIIKAANIKGE
jgi:hypothetical protein